MGRRPTGTRATVDEYLILEDWGATALDATWIVWSESHNLRDAVANLLDLADVADSVVPADEGDFISAVSEHQRDSFLDGVIVYCCGTESPGRIVKTVERVRAELLWEGGLVLTALVARELPGLFGRVDVDVASAPGTSIVPLQPGKLFSALRNVGGCTREQWDDFRRSRDVVASVGSLRAGAIEAIGRGDLVASMSAVRGIQGALRTIDWDIVLGHRAAVGARELLNTSPNDDQEVQELIQRLTELSRCLEKS